MSTPTIWQQPFEIRSYFLDFQKRLGLHGLLCMLQETAWQHSDALGFGYQPTRERGAIWILIRQRIEIWEWPAWGEKVTIRSWLRPPSVAVVVRDFEVWAGERKVGQAAAHWITMDEATRRPIPLVFPAGAGLFHSPDSATKEPRRLRPRLDLERLGEVRVRNSDLDMHEHVNNTQFAQWILDAIPLSHHKTHQLRLYEVDFLAEVRPHDNVTISWAPGANPIAFQGSRLGDDKVLFAAALTVDVV